MCHAAILRDAVEGDRVSKDEGGVWVLEKVGNTDPHGEEAHWRRLEP